MYRKQWLRKCRKERTAPAMQLRVREGNWDATFCALSSLPVDFLLPVVFLTRPFSFFF
jgi:hypothetical protein